MTQNQPTSDQLTAIANQGRYPGTNTSIPSTRQKASLQIAANDAIIKKQLASRPPSDKTMERIQRLEQMLGYMGQTNSYAVGAPQNELEARQMLEQLKKKHKAQQAEKRRAQPD